MASSNPDSAESFGTKNNNFENHVDTQESCLNSESGLNTTPENNLKYSVIKLELTEKFNEHDHSNIGYDHSVLYTGHQELHKNTKDFQDPPVKIEPQGVYHIEMLDSEDDQDLPVKFEAGDLEASGRGVDGGLRGGLKEENVASSGINDKKLFFFQIISKPFL